MYISCFYVMLTRPNRAVKSASQFSFFFFFKVRFMLRTVTGLCCAVRVNTFAKLLYSPHQDSQSTILSHMSYLLGITAGSAQVHRANDWIGLLISRYPISQLARCNF